MQQLGRSKNEALKNNIKNTINCSVTLFHNSFYFLFQLSILHVIIKRMQGQHSDVNKVTTERDSNHPS